MIWSHPATRLVIDTLLLVAMLLRAFTATNVRDLAVVVGLGVVLICNAIRNMEHQR